MLQPTDMEICNFIIQNKVVFVEEIFCKYVINLKCLFKKYMRFLLCPSKWAKG